MLKGKRPVGQTSSCVGLVGQTGSLPMNTCPHLISLFNLNEDTIFGQPCIRGKKCSTWVLLAFQDSVFVSQDGIFNL